MLPALNERQINACLFHPGLFSLQMKIIKTDKFINNTVSFRQMLHLDEKTITALNVLILMMRGRSQKYPSRDAYTKALNHAYAARVVTGLTGYGKNVLADTRIHYIDPGYIEDAGYMDEILDLADQALFHPVLTEEVLEEAKYLLKNRMISARENPDTLAVLEAMKIAEPGTSLAVPVSGIPEKVDAITLEDVKAIWEVMQNTPYQVMMAGDIEDGDAMLEFAEKLPQTAWDTLDYDLASRHDVNTSSIQKELSQSSLAQVYATGISPEDEDSYALMVMNSILGTAPMSLLFEEIREKHSYCYSISSSIIRFDGALLISTGTRAKNMDDVRRLIQEQINTLKNNAFSEELFQSAKLDLIDALNSQQDSEMAMINQAFLNALLKRDIDVAALQDKIRQVTREDVARMAENLSLVSEAVVLEDEALASQAEEEDIDIDIDEYYEEEESEEMFG